MLIYFVTFSQPCTIQHTGIGHNDTVVPYFDIIFNVSKRLNDHILSDFAPGAIDANGLIIIVLYLKLIFSSAAQCLIEAHYSLHPVEGVVYLR